MHRTSKPLCHQKCTCACWLSRNSHIYSAVLQAMNMYVSSTCQAAKSLFYQLLMETMLSFIRPRTPMTCWSRWLSLSPSPTTPTASHHPDSGLTCSWSLTNSCHLLGCLVLVLGHPRGITCELYKPSHPQFLAGKWELVSTS